MDLSTWNDLRIYRSRVASLGRRENKRGGDADVRLLADAVECLLALAIGEEVPGRRPLRPPPDDLPGVSTSPEPTTSPSPPLADPSRA